MEGDADSYSCNIVFKAPEGEAQDSVHKELGELNGHMVTIRSSGHKAWEATELKYIRAEGQEAEEGDEVRKCLEGTFCLTDPEKKMWAPQAGSATLVKCGGPEGCGMWLEAGHLREHFLCGHAGEEHEKDLLFQAGYVLATNAEAFGEDAGLSLIHI